MACTYMHSVQAGQLCRFHAHPLPKIRPKDNRSAGGFGRFCVYPWEHKSSKEERRRLDMVMSSRL